MIHKSMIPDQKLFQNNGIIHDIQKTLCTSLFV